LKLFKKLGIQDKVTWFVPMHSAESFPDEFKSIVESGCEIGLHGYCHEVSDDAFKANSFKKTQEKKEREIERERE